MRSSSSLLFGLILGLSFALVVWWTVFLLMTSGDLAAAGAHLAAGDVHGAARALGAADAESLVTVGRRRQWMFASEGVFFGLVLLVCGWLFLLSSRRENALRHNQDRFLAAATHELKTPLATIVLLLESLRDGRVPDDKRARHLTNGLLEAERLERGLHNVLTAAGLRTTGRPMHPEAGDLSRDVREAVDAMQARAQAADVTIETDTPDHLTARRDAAAMQLVLRNLLDNAIKFSPGGSTVHVALQRHGNEARVLVRDAGRGLDEHELQNAFQPFWRGSDAASGGTGLGLHLVHELVVAHGGTAQADSDGRDRGSVFTVRLPLEDAR